MSMQTIDPLVLDLIEWVAREPRSHADVMEAWRTSCPRLTVWEEALERRLLRRTNVAGQGARVVVTPSGQRLLRNSGRVTPAAGVMTHRAAE
jgi:hypothetical protein